KAQAMVENASVLGGDAEVVTLCEFNHPVRRLGIVNDDLQRWCETRLQTCETRGVLRYRAGAKVKFRGDSAPTDSRDHVLESASRAQRLTEPVQAQRSATARRGPEVDRERVVNWRRAKVVLCRIRVGNHRAACREKRRLWQHVGLDAFRQRVG